MMARVLVTSLCLFLTTLCHGQPQDFFLRSAYPTWSPDPVSEEVGPRLIVTPYLETNRAQRARRLAAVSGGPFSEIGIPSYSGFFTVNKKYNSNLFFWYFPAEYDYENAPVLLWLQGGPGSSSLFGLFEEIGPFTLEQNSTTLEPHPYSWHKNHSLLFIDNPVGTGFSFTDFEGGYATNQTQIGIELYSALDQFLTLFPELRRLPFFIAGESYAGKYVPTLAYTIHKMNPTARNKINLHGIAVGNGWTDPVNMMDISSYLFQLGFVDDNMRQEMKQYEENAVRAIEQENYEDAAYNNTHVLRMFTDHTEFYNVYNFLNTVYPFRHRDYSRFVQRDDVRKAIHVGDAEYGDGHTVYVKLYQDLMQSVKPWLEEVLDNYRVLYYSGQLDIIVAYPLSVRMFQNLKFGAAEEYCNAKRYPWYVGKELAGFVKSGGNFTEVLVRNAGHMVPTDQPKWALDLITKFTRDEFYHPYGDGEEESNSAVKQNGILPLGEDED